MIYSRKTNKPQHPVLKMNNLPLTPVNEHKHLGLILSDDGKWQSHISSYLNKAWQRIGILRSLKFTLNRSALERMYFSFVRPLLEYADVVWSNCTDELKTQIESVQIEAARIVSGATKLCNIDKLFHDLRWESLENRRKKHKLILMYKMVNKLSPQYLSDLVPEQTQARYTLRNANNIPLLHCRTQLYSKSYLPSTIREWNNLSDNEKNAPSLATFKAMLSKTDAKPPIFYNIGSRQGQILHTRLRLSCSSLNHDLHRRSIVDSPTAHAVRLKQQATSYFIVKTTDAKGNSTYRIFLVRR